MKTILILAASLLLAGNVCAQPEGMKVEGRGTRVEGQGPQGRGPRGRGMGGMFGGASGAAKTYSFGSEIKDIWKYDKESNTYYIVGLMYCSNPVDVKHEQLGIYVPAEYMDAKASSDTTFTCTINKKGTVNGLTALTAPIVLPVNTPGYSAMSAPSGANSRVKEFTSKGLIYLAAGCRGKDSGAPSGVTDLKAAIRYFRYLAKEQKAVPGDASKIFSFGHSGGGAQSSLLGATGNSKLYDPYLKALGAKMEYKDDLYGSMCWCPITNLDLADEAYEWNMGMTRSNLSEEEQNISKALAKEFAEYINNVGLKHPKTGEVLKLTATDDGFYQGGSYYEYIVDFINDAVSRYNKYNNANVSAYDPKSNKAVTEFSSSNKRASKGLGAFDAYVNKGSTSPENQLFDPEGKSAHFDKQLGEIVAEYAPSNSESFTTDFAKKDKVRSSLDTRLMMYTPLYYLINNKKYYNGGGKGNSDVAPHWRIRTGIKQGDTSLCTEVDLAVALQNYGIKDVDLETIWNQGHTEAEDTGSGNANFIEWVIGNLKVES